MLLHDFDAAFCYLLLNKTENHMNLKPFSNLECASRQSFLQSNEQFAVVACINLVNSFETKPLNYWKNFFRYKFFRSFLSFLFFRTKNKSVASFCDTQTFLRLTQCIPKGKLENEKEKEKQFRKVWRERPKKKRERHWKKIEATTTDTQKIYESVCHNGIICLCILYVQKALVYSAFY